MNGLLGDVSGIVRGLYIVKLRVCGQDTMTTEREDAQRKSDRRRIREDEGWVKMYREKVRGHTAALMSKTWARALNSSEVAALLPVQTGTSVRSARSYDDEKVITYCRRRAAQRFRAERRSGRRTGLERKYIHMGNKSSRKHVRTCGGEKASGNGVDNRAKVTDPFVP